MRKICCFLLAFILLIWLSGCATAHLSKALEENNDVAREFYGQGYHNYKDMRLYGHDEQIEVIQGRQYHKYRFAGALKDKSTDLIIHVPVVDYSLGATYPAAIVGHAKSEKKTNVIEGVSPVFVFPNYPNFDSLLDGGRKAKSDIIVVTHRPQDDFDVLYFIPKGDVIGKKPNLLAFKVDYKLPWDERSRFLSWLLPLGYAISVPLDIVTAPLQFVFVLGLIL